jgi:Domain of unknown function (DUF6285)
MTDHSEIANLLKAAEKLLRDTVVAHSQSDTRFAGLMVASAISMVERSLRFEQDRAAATRDVDGLVPIPNPFASNCEALVHLIRGGVMDGADDAYRRLLVDAIIRTSVTKPSTVTALEQRLAGLEE